VDVERALRKPGDACQNLIGSLGPYKRLRIRLMRINEFLNGGFELRHTLVRPASQLFVRQFSEPPLDQTHPRPIRGREVDVKSGAFGEPVADERRLVGAVVVHDDVHVQGLRNLGVDQIEKFPELDRAVTLVKLRDHLTGFGVERREQRRRAVPVVVMRAPLHLAGPHRQQRLCAIERLDLRFLVDAEDRRMFRRIQIQPHDVPHFLHEQRILGQCEGFAPMRLQAERPPDPIDRHPTQARGLGHAPHAPVRGAAWGCFQGPNNHLLDALVGDGPRGSRPRFVIQPIEPIAYESATPLADRRRRHVQPPGHHFAVVSVGAGQYDPRPARQEGRRPRAVGQRFESLTFLVGQNQRGFRASRSHARLLVEQYEQAALFVSSSTGTGH
jgi:hypothetical protein